jgi:voltage-gated sodium channel
VSFIFIATFIMVNLIIAIVVEAMWKLSQEEEGHIIDTIEDSQQVSQADIKRLEDKIDALTRAIKH